MMLLSTLPPRQPALTMENTPEQRKIVPVSYLFCAMSGKYTCFPVSG